MATKTKKTPPAPPPEETGRSPTREAVLAFLNGADNPTKRDLAKAFGVKGDARRDLKRIVQELQEDGEIARGRKKLQPRGRLPNLLVADIISRHRDGDLVAKPAEWEEPGEAPRIEVRASRGKSGKGPTPGIGARVLLRIEHRPEASPREAAYSGRLIKVLDRAKARVYGVFRPDERAGGGWAAPTDKRGIPQEIRIPEGMTDDAREAELVAIEPLRGSSLGPPTGRVIERFGSVKSEKAVSLIALVTHGIPHVFSPATLAEAKATRVVDAEGREDRRDLALVTIDPVDAKDHDDAVHAATDSDPANPGGHIVIVAIADVAAYVRPGTAMDGEAVERGNSVYFPDRVVPMLPERISNDLCSLRPDEDRPAIAVRMVLDAHGEKRRHSFHRILMRSRAKLSYEQAQRAFEGMPDAATAPFVEEILRPLFAAYETAKTAREKRSPLDLDLPERKLVLNRDGSLKEVRRPERLEAHRLIEEFMILANVAAAETLEAQHASLVYRVHEPPSMQKLEELSEFLKSINVKFARGERPRPQLFNGVLARAKGSPIEALINEVVLRAQSQAVYTPENAGHFGLNLRRYAHFTSPIRRYADLIVHRALIRALRFGDDAGPAPPLRDLAEIAANLSAAERRAMAAERETVDRLVAGFLADRVGAVFNARISGVTRFGLFVRLAETGADGFVPAATLGTDYYRFEEGRRALVGARTRETFSLGDGLDVRLVEAAPFAGALRFELARGAAPARPPRMDARSRRRR